MSESIRGYVWRVSPDDAWRWSPLPMTRTPADPIEILPAILLIEPEPVGWAEATFVHGMGERFRWNYLWRDRQPRTVPLYALEEAGDATEPSR